MSRPASVRGWVMAAGCAAVIAASLVGCSPTGNDPAATPSAAATIPPEALPTAPVQTEAEACAALEVGMGSLQTELSNGVNNLSSDPAGASVSIHKVVDQYTTNAGTVTNDTVRPLATAAVTALTGLATEVDKYAAQSPESTAITLSTSAVAVQTAFTALQDVCG